MLRFMTARSTLALVCACLGIMATAGEAPEDVDVPPRDVPQTREEIDFVRQVFDTLQPESIARNLEYCGYIGLNPDGTLVATDARRGSTDACYPRWPARHVTVIASYHTHAAHNPEYDSEVPSYDDIASDILELVDGYVATPGGRIWYIDAYRKEVRIVCGVGCTESDPTFRPDPLYPVSTYYSLRDLATMGQ